MDKGKADVDALRVFPNESSELTATGTIGRAHSQAALWPQFLFWHNPGATPGFFTTAAYKISLT